MRMASPSRVLALVLTCVLSSVVRGQQLRGVVRDSATQTPLGGAVITLVDATGLPLARAISNENGLYFVAVAAGARNVNVLRIGFRALAVSYQSQIVGGIVVRLKDTDYLASPNARGIIEIPYLLPGPYVPTVVDSALQRLGITLPTSLTFEAERDSLTQRSFSVPQREEERSLSS